MTTAAIEEPQNMRALAYANEIRLKRAALKRTIDAGERTVAEVLEEIPGEAETMTVGTLLRAQHRWGRVRVRKLCVALAINENRELGRLTLRQRALIAASLR